VAEAVETALSLGEGNLIIATETNRVDAPTSAPEGDDQSNIDDDDTAGDLPQTDAHARGATGRRVRQRARGARPIAGDLNLSAHYACTHCNLSFEPPSPQLFSFNSPQGMCPECDGLGELYTFDPAALIPDANKSFQQGCVELIGPWKDVGRWRRHIFQGVADTIEHEQGLEAGSLLETRWSELKPELAPRWRCA
jgi:excinuclease ABC subunit A